MAGTRASTRNSNNSSPTKSENAVAGTKRKQETEPSPKRERKTAKKQATIEDMIGDTKEGDSEMNVAAPSVQGQDAKVDTFEEKPDESQAEEDTNVDEKTSDNLEEDAKVEQNSDAKSEANNSEAKVERKDDEPKDTELNDGTEKANVDSTLQDKKTVSEPKSSTVGDGAIEESSQREKQVPSNILEKGVIYFFTRNRVSIDDASSVGDLQRTFFVLRPIPIGAKLGDGVLQDLKNNRLMALPKKVFPKSSNDKFMAFVEKANTTIQDLKDNFFKGDTYETKTQGTRQNDPVTPVAEGVYAITRTEDATTHLIYSTTIPSDLGEVQEDLGIKSQGSFIISVKNPERSGPASAQLAQKPDFSQEIIDAFRGLAWSEVKPHHLDHEFTQILLIGEKAEAGMEPTTKDQKHDKETPQEELEQLEHEDELRVQHLHGDDSVFDDLKISKEEYKSVPNTW